MIFLFVLSVILTLLGMGLGVGFLLWSNQFATVHYFEKKIARWAGLSISTLSLFMLFFSVMSGIVYWTKDYFKTPEITLAQKHKTENLSEKAKKAEKKLLVQAHGKETLSFHTTENFKKIQKGAIEKK